jgi:WD repeat-containing protein 23
MASGEFGVNELQSTNSVTGKKRLARRILDREMGKEEGSRRKINQQLMVQGMLPSTHADMIVHYNSPVYSGQFSDDGNFFYACVKDFKVRMYDTSNPYKWVYYKTVNYYGGQWTLTDATLSPDNKYLAYSSIQPNVHLSPTDPNDLGDGYVLDLYDSGRRGRGGFRSRHGSFGIWSIRFSGDGRELVAGTSANSVVVYDIESRRTVLEIPAHDEDVNAVCFGDASSPHIIYSGSDDTILKVFDRRSLGDSREAGAFVGHIEGITYIDSKGDGRYIISNGKDSSCKLWDLRMAMTTARFTQIDPQAYTSNFDYRWGAYDDDDWRQHPHDNSLVTFRGHKGILRSSLNIVRRLTPFEFFAPLLDAISLLLGAPIQGMCTVGVQMEKFMSGISMLL